MEFGDKRDKRYPERVYPDDLEAPEKGYRIYKDAVLLGFGLRVTAAGARSFVLDYTVSGRSRRYTIGQWPAWSVDAARTRAKELRREADDGNDPQEQKQAKRDELTLSDYIEERYRPIHMTRLRKNTQDAYDRVLRLHILPNLGSKKLSEIDHDDIVKLHSKISAKAPIQANRAIATLSKVFSLALKNRLIDVHPVKGIERNQERKDNVRLSSDEIARLIIALDQYASRSDENRSVASAIKLIAMTGARKTEVLSATWDMFNLEEGRWVKPSSHTKQKLEHSAPLNSAALEVLRDLDRTSKAVAAEFGMKRPDYVFPGSGRTGHLVEIKKGWLAVKEVAGLLDEQCGKRVRIHSLRHSFASLLVNQGISLNAIGALLGHSNTATTDRYAHADFEPLRKASEIVAMASGGEGQGAINDMKAMMLKLRKQAAAIAAERGVSVDQVIAELMGLVSSR